MFIEEKIYTVSEAASILRCSSQKIYHLIHNKSLGAYKDVGGRPWHIPNYCIESYVYSCMSDKTSIS